MLTLQWRYTTPESQSGDVDRGLWQTVDTNAIPLKRPVVIHIGPGCGGLADSVRRLVDRLQDLMGFMGGEATPSPQLQPWRQGPEDACRLEVVLGDGKMPISLEPRFTAAAMGNQSTFWILPLLPSVPQGACLTLPSDLQLLNCAFWQGEAIDELAPTVLARAGVTSLDRRVFLSYRRKDSEPMAQQLFDALGRRNIDVFLDTVRIEPGVDFQARLFEQLADKSMVVILESASFHESKWATEEVAFSLRNDLSLLILRLPGVEEKDQLRGARASDQVVLQPSDLRRFASGPPHELTKKALKRVVEMISRVHDIELVRRLGAVRRRTLDTLGRRGLSVSLGEQDAAINVRGAGATERWRVMATGRPPGLEDLHDASNRHASIDEEADDLRIVVGPTGGFPNERRHQLDWVVKGRNVLYCDVAMLDTLFDTLHPERS